jgi:hypothetical protein
MRDRNVVTDGPSLGDIRATVVARLRSRRVEIEETILTQILNSVPEAAVGDPTLAAGLREMIAACLDCGLASIEQGSRWSGLIPPAVAAHARRSHEQRRAEIVQRLLVCEPVDAGELAELRYDLDAWHVAVIVTGDSAEEAVRRLAAGLGCRILLTPCDARTVWAWLGGSRQLAFSDIDRVRAAGGSSGVSLAVGEPGRGVEGWRTTHREAQGALLVAQDRPSEIVRYLDVALDAAVLQDDALADRLIGKHLCPLEDVSIGGQAARRTIRALFDAEHNVSSAASALNAHRSSVHRWRDQIEGRLGYRLHEHQAEIEVALRIEGLRKHRASRLAG